MALGLVALWAAILPLTAEPAPAADRRHLTGHVEGAVPLPRPERHRPHLRRRAGQGAGPRRLRDTAAPRSATGSATSIADARQPRPPRLTVRPKNRGRPAHDASVHPAAASRRVRHGATGHCHIGDLAALPGQPARRSSMRLGIVAIATMFFLQGARLSREAVLAGMTNWKLHAAIAGTTFVLFPLLGTALIALMPHALDRTLVLGVLFLCALPSTVQSSIALTSIARGNVAGAVCAATASSLIGHGVHAAAVRLHVARARRRRGCLQHVAGVRPTAAAVRRRPSAAAVDRPMGGAQQVAAGDHRPRLDPAGGLHRVQRRRGPRHLAPGAADDARARWRRSSRRCWRSA